MEVIANDRNKTPTKINKVISPIAGSYNSYIFSKLHNLIFLFMSKKSTSTPPQRQNDSNRDNTRNSPKQPDRVQKKDIIFTTPTKPPKK